MFPSRTNIKMALLGTLVEMGGEGRPKDIYPRVARHIHGLTEADLAETRPTGGNKWQNEVAWARMELVQSGDVDSSRHGVWSITKKGRQRAEMEVAEVPVWDGPERPEVAPGPREQPRDRQGVGLEAGPDLEQLAEKYVSAFRKKVLQQLQDLTPRQFERFAAALLSAYGFPEVTVTGRAGDGGIDGHGKLKVGLATMSVAFQCKRWQGVVGRPEVDKFRGAIQGEYEQGIFFTTSDFSKEAQEASIKKGAAPIVLINGDAIVQLMLEKGLGIQRRPVEVFEDQLQTLFEEDET